ncbi:MAG: DMT family transporter [Rhizobiales bacterium]|nr:DMT family transporter [Hyphomicrobiales bacterium]
MNERSSPTSAAMPAASGAAPREERLGVILVFLSALLWSLGGTIARFIETPDHWAVVFWRSMWAIAFLVAFMLWRDGLRRSLSLFREMGAPGIAVALCFATASTAFIVALGYTTVANILLMQAGAPLIAALLGWLAFREPVSRATWLAIAAVIFGIVVMVSDSLDGGISPVGDGLALMIAVSLAVATVLTRRYAHVRMTPAVCLGTIIAGVLAATQTANFAVTGADMGFLFAFGAINLGLGLALFASGARLIPAALAALLGTFEPILGPIWVWLVHGEEPSERTLIGGAIVFAAVLAHIALEFRRRARPRKPGVSGLPTPH